VNVARWKRGTIAFGPIGKVFGTALLFGLLISSSEALAGLTDVTQPGDPIVASSNNSPGSEGVANLIDNNTTNKYLNFDKLNTGFTVTPSVGATIVTGIGLTSANDAPERDPASFTVEGSNNGTNFTLIASNTVPSFSSRFTEQDFTFPNTYPYKIYRVRFPTVANAAAANSMQLSEVQLFGGVAQSIPLHLAGGTNRLTLLSSPFEKGGNTLNDLLPGVSEGTTVFRFNNSRGNFNSDIFHGGGWNRNSNIPGGTGYFVYSDVAQDVALTGALLPQGTKFSLLQGFNLVGSIWTTNRTIDQINFPSPQFGDTIYLFDETSQAYQISQFVEGEWTASLVIRPGCGFFVHVTTARDWVLNP